MAMKINNIINNNIVSAFDDEGKEVIVMGKGIGYDAKKGKRIGKSKVDKIFRMDSQNAFNELSDMLENIPSEHFELTNDVINFANKILDKELNKNIYLTLTDHISFAIERYKKGFEFTNPLLYSIKALYKKEFEIAEYAIDLINKRFHINFNKDEAASIALHFVNAQYNLKMHESIDVTKLIKEVFKIIKSSLNITIDENSLACERFITHLRFFALRIIKKERSAFNDTDFKNMIFEQYLKEYECSKKIADYIFQEFSYKVQDEELLYLTVHIRRLNTH